MSRKTAKQLLADFVTEAFNDHEKVKQELIEQIQKNQLTGTFGEAHVQHAQRTESLIKALDLTPEFIAGEEFEKLTDEQIQEWINGSYKSMKRRENDYLRGGISERDMYQLSGVAQYRVFLEQFIK